MIEKGSSVKIHYTLKVEGKVVFSSQGKDPFPYTHGQNEILRGLEEELEGMNVGEQKNFNVAPEKAYGPPNPDAIKKLPKTTLEAPDRVKVGDQLEGTQGDRPVRATVLEINNDTITMDFNHPLAGKTLNFDVEVMEVRKAS